MHISFFDSGKGGYYIGEYFKKQFPQYSVTIHTDPENVPYGNKDDVWLQNTIEKQVHYLFDHGAQLIIIACNTISTTHLKHVQDTLVKNNYPEKRVLGVAIPTIEEIINSSCRSLLILGTENTIGSKYFEKKFAELGSDKKIISRSLPTVATLIEQDNYQKTEEIIAETIDSVQDSFDGIVLACTHYTVLKDFLRKQYPEKQIFSQDEIIAKKLKQYLDNHPEIDVKVMKE